MIFADCTPIPLSERPLNIISLLPNIYLTCTTLLPVLEHTACCHNSVAGTPYHHTQGADPGCTDYTASYFGRKHFREPAGCNSAANTAAAVVAAAELDRNHIVFVVAVAAGYTNCSLMVGGSGFATAPDN